MKKRVLTMALALMLALSLSSSALASVTTPGGTGDTTLSYSVSTAFSVTIPETVDLVPSTAVEENLTVTIINIPHGTCIKAAITKINNDTTESNFLVKNEDDNTKTIAYTVETSDDDITYATYTKDAAVGGLTESGTIYFRYTLAAIPAGHPTGTYSGTVTFTITNPAVS